jgi:hypothetical protein
MARADINDRVLELERQNKELRATVGQLSTQLRSAPVLRLAYDAGSRIAKLEEKLMERFNIKERPAPFVMSSHKVLKEPALWVLWLAQVHPASEQIVTEYEVPGPISMMFSAQALRLFITEKRPVNPWVTQQLRSLERHFVNIGLAVCHMFTRIEEQYLVHMVEGEVEAARVVVFQLNRDLIKKTVGRGAASAYVLGKSLDPEQFPARDQNAIQTSVKRARLEELTEDQEYLMPFSSHGGRGRRGNRGGRGGRGYGQRGGRGGRGSVSTSDQTRGTGRGRGSKAPEDEEKNE